MTTRTRAFNFPRSLRNGSNVSNSCKTRRPAIGRNGTNLKGFTMNRFNLNAAISPIVMLMNADAGGASGGAADATTATTEKTPRDKSGTPIIYADEPAMIAAELKKGYSKFIVTDSAGVKYFVASRSSDGAVGFVARTKLSFTVAVHGKTPRGASKGTKAAALLESLSDDERNAILQKFLAGNVATPGTVSAAGNVATPAAKTTAPGGTSTAAGTANAANANASAPAKTTTTPAAGTHAATSGGKGGNANAGKGGGKK